MAASPSVLCPPLATTFIGLVVSSSSSSSDYPVHQFRGIPYATIPARFRQSQLNTVYPPITDARRHGPVAPQVIRQDDDDDAVQDEFACLNLVITRPGTSGPPLPVMIWIHGRATSGRAHLDDDPANFIQASMQGRQPVIVVHVNYRLGLLGFAASEALEAANRLCGESGVGNYGLHDQLNAITWVRRYIAHFGGDPASLTLFGDGAGASHIHALLLSRHQPPVHRAILQGGVLRPAAVQAVPVQTVLLTRVMARLDVRTVEELRRVPVALLVAQTPAWMSPTDDGTFFREDWRISPVPMQPLIVGDCPDGLMSVAAWTTTALIRRVRAVIRGAYKAERMLRTYGLEWSTEDDEAREVARRIVGDVLHAWPIDQLATAAAAAAQRDVYRYAFDQESPLMFPTRQPLDVLHLFDNTPPPPKKMSLFESSGSETSEDAFTDSASDSEDAFSDDTDDDDDEAASDLRYLGLSNATYNTCRVREAMRARWLAFAHGRAPWAASRLFVLGPEGEVGERGMADEVPRRRRVGEEAYQKVLDSVGPDVLERLAMELVGGPSVGMGLAMPAKNRV